MGIRVCMVLRIKMEKWLLSLLTMKLGIFMVVGAIVKVGTRRIGKSFFGALSDGVYGLITPKGDYEVDPEGLIL